MSGDRVSVDTDLIRMAAGGFEGKSDAVTQVLNRLTGRLIAAGPAWGDDKMGNEFAKEYEPSSDGELTGLMNLVTALTTIGTNLRTMADNYEATEEANTDIITGGDSPDGT